MAEYFTWHPGLGEGLAEEQKNMRCAIVSLTGPLAEGMGEVKGGREVMHRRPQAQNSYVQSCSLFTEIKFGETRDLIRFQSKHSSSGSRRLAQTMLLIVSVLIFRKSLYDTNEKEI